MRDGVPGGRVLPLQSTNRRTFRRRLSQKRATVFTIFFLLPIGFVTYQATPLICHRAPLGIRWDEGGRGRVTYRAMPAFTTSLTSLIVYLATTLFLSNRITSSFVVTSAP